MKSMLMLAMALVLLSTVSAQQCCRQLSQDSRRCLMCPETMRFYKGHCLFQIPYCLNYSGVQCSQCVSPYVPSAEGYCEKSEVTFVDNNRALMLLDFVKFVYQGQLGDADLIRVFDRRYSNETVHTFAQFLTQDNLKYQIQVYFPNTQFLNLNVISFKRIGTPDLANSESNHTEEASSLTDEVSSLTDEAGSSTEQTQDAGEAQMKQNSFHQSQVRSIYRYMPIRQRNQDQVFLKIDSLLKQAFSSKLGNNPIQVAVYMKAPSIYNYHYQLYYQSSIAGRATIYQVTVIYNQIRNKAYVTSFRRTFYK